MGNLQINLKAGNRNNSMENQEMLYKLSQFEQQIQQLNQQLQAVEQGINDLSSLEIDLNEIKGSEGKEILAPVGRGIYAKAKLLSENLTVDVGGKNFVKKSVSETQELIKKQTEKLEEVKKELNDYLDSVTKEAENIIGSSK